MRKTGPIRLIVLDLDGTLLNEQFELTAEVRAAVGRARQAGLELVVATGRDLKSATPFLRELNLEDRAITSGGALVWVDGRIVAKKSFTRAQFADILKLGGAFETGFFVDQPERTWSFGNRVYTEMYAHVSDSLPTDRIPPTLDPLPIKVSLIQERSLLLRLREDLASRQPGVGLVFPFEHVLDVNPPGADKGTALRRLAGFLHVPMGQVAVVGDSENDLSLFRAVRASFAMGNAPPHVRRAAAWVVPGNDRDGAARAIQAVLDLNRSGGSAT